MDISKDAVGIETILVRLDGPKQRRLGELWNQVDEQIIAPEKRIALDRNGLRAGKFSGAVPRILEDWLQDTQRRLADDPMEQTGLASDISSFAQLWRCRPNVRKELTVRNLTNESVCVFYNDGTAKGRTYQTPHFLYELQAIPFGDASATIRLTPEIQHGELLRKVITRDAAIRTDVRRDSVVWDQLSIELRINRGDSIIIGPTQDMRGLGQHFFQTRTKEGELQPVLLLVRLAETRLDDAFEPQEVAKAKRNLE